MFTPPDALYAARKVALVKDAFDHAGHPLSREDCRRLVAKAWGYDSWSEALLAVDEADEVGPFDEALAGEDYIEQETHSGAVAVALRRGATVDAFREVTGLPSNLADDFACCIPLTDDPAGSRRTRSFDSRPKGRWLSPAEFSELLQAGLEPPPAIWANFARGLAISAGKLPSVVPPLPAHRPRR